MALLRSAKGFSILLLLYVSPAMAQWPCSSWPADCPDTDGISNVASQDVSTSNFVSPKEFAMQNSLRTVTTKMMKALALHEGWRMEDFDEIAGEGMQAPGGEVLLADNLRPPHEYYIVFQFIINKDSLMAWRNWEIKFTQNYTNSPAEEKEDHDKTLLFRDASIVQVYFEFNADVGRGLDHIVKGTPSSLPGASRVIWFHNPDPDFQSLDWHYKKAPCVAEILMGPWQSKPDSYNGYRSVFLLNPKNIDQKSIKKIPSDKVQTIAIHICGRKDIVQKVVSQLDMNTLKALLVK